MKHLKRRILDAAMLALIGIFMFPSVALAAVNYPDTAYQIRQMEVYRNYVEDNDQLYLISFNLVYTAGTPTTPIDNTFIFRLWDGGAIVTTGTAYGWFSDGYDGYGIVAFYLSAADAPAWGGAYTVYFEGNPTLAWAGGVPPSINSNVFSLWYDGGDVDSTQDRLATRLRYIAQELETNWGGTTDLIEDVAGRKVLTTDGEDYFENTIPFLRDRVPQIFAQSMEAAEFTDDILVEDYWASSNDTVVNVQGANWFAQTFTASSAYSITGVQIPVYRVGNPGDITISVRATAAGVPTGADLTSGTFDDAEITANPEGEWIDVAFSDYALTANTVYAIVIRAPAGGVANYIAWPIDTGNGYTRGQECTSVNSGVAWAGVAANDGLFEILVRGGAGLRYGHRYEAQLLGTDFDVSQIATNWGISNMMVSTIYWLAMTVILIIGMAMATRAFDTWWVMVCLMAAYGWRWGIADTYLLVAVLVLSALGILFPLFFKRVY